MKNLAVTMVMIITVSSVQAQKNETRPTTENSKDKMTYYQKRAKEDAVYEQRFEAASEEENEAFWDEQESYEKDLKKRDRKAYRAYMKGKRDAYQEHYEHCDSHCHHDAHYYHHASFYYYGYRNHYYYDRYPRGSSIHTRVRIGAPSVRLGIL